MKKEITKLQQMLKSINNPQESNRPGTSNTKHKKESSETTRNQEQHQYKSQLISDLRFKEIYNLMNINLPSESTKRSNKVITQYKGNSVTKQKQTKTQKIFSSVMNEIFPESHIKNTTKLSSNKLKYQLKFNNQPRPSFQSKKSTNSNTVINNYLDHKVSTKLSIGSKYSSYFTSNDYYNTEDKSIREYKPPQRLPLNYWFTKQQEKYKNVFYQEKSNNIRNLVSITDNKEHRITNNFYANFNMSKESTGNNTSKTLLNCRNQSKEKPYEYNAVLDHFSNRLFKKEPLVTQSNEYSKYSIPSLSEHFTACNTSSLKKDSLINNYNK